MSTLPSPVLPGQIISSKIFNDLIAAMQEFQSRLDAIQSGPGTPTSIIDHFDPLGQQSVGSQLTIFGKFDFPPSLNVVKIGDAPQLSASDFRAGSNDSQLIFAIPSTIAVPTGTTKDVHIVVSNSRGSDDKIYRLLPAVISAIPNPAIGNITNFDNPGQPPQTQQKIKITGSNFATLPQNNVVTFTIQLAPGVSKTYPPAGGAPAAIDVANTNLGQVVVSVPDIPEIALGSTSPVTVTVDVGSPLPASKLITMAR